jgi:hypothetical protein
MSVTPVDIFNNDIDMKINTIYTVVPRAAGSLLKNNCSYFPAIYFEDSGVTREDFYNLIAVKAE